MKQSWNILAVLLVSASWYGVAHGQDGATAPGTPTQGSGTNPANGVNQSAKTGVIPDAQNLGKVSDPTTNGDLFGLDISQSNSKMSAKKDLSKVFGQDVSVTGSVPLTADSSNLKITSLDAMANGFSLQFSIKYVSARSDYDKTLLTDFCRNEFWPAAEKATPPIKPADGDYCDCNGYEEVYPLKNLRLSQKYHLISTAWQPTYIWGATAGIGYQQHAYFDTDDLAKKNADKFPWSVGGYFGLEPTTSTPNLIVFSYKHQYDAKDNKQKVDCPAGSIDTTKCVYGSIGTPEMQSKDLLSVEYRDIVSNKFAFTVSPTYDATNRIWSVDLPIWFVSVKGKLSGGVDLSWKSNPGETAIGLFFSQPITLGK